MSRLNADDMLAKILDAVQETHAQVNNIQGQVNNIQGQVNDIQEQVSSMATRLVNVETLAIQSAREISSLKSTVDVIEKDVKQIKEQDRGKQRQVDQLEFKVSQIRVDLNELIDKVNQLPSNP